jgi:hypothetical protein
MEPIHMTDEALQYPNEWVAFSIDFQRVVGHGATAVEAQQMAKDSNEEHAVLFFIPEAWPEALIL